MQTALKSYIKRHKQIAWEITTRMVYETPSKLNAWLCKTNPMTYEPFSLIKATMTFKMHVNMQDLHDSYVFTSTLESFLTIADSNN